MLKQQFIKKRSKLQKMLCNFIFSSFLVIFFVFKANSHEELLNSLVIYHPYLIKENKTEAFGFLSIENTGTENEYLINILPHFASEYKLLKQDLKENDFFKIDLQSGLKIPPKEAIYIDQDSYKLLFLNLDKNLDWFDTHSATFVFQYSGEIELDFEVEQ